MPEVPPPGVRDAVVREGKRRRARLLTALVAVPALLAAAAVAVPAALTTEDRLLPAAPLPSPTPVATAPPAAPCPATLTTKEGDLSVPAPPGDDLRDALVPGETPLRVTTCRYGDASRVGFGRDSKPPDEVPLEAARVMQGGLEQLPSDLAVPPVFAFGYCTLIGGALHPYLVQVQYADRTVWLRTRQDPNACEPVTNGAYTSTTYVGDQVHASHVAGEWVPEPRQPNARAGQSPCPREPVGRAGQEQTFVPAGWERLVVCIGQDGREEVRDVERTRAEGVVALLNGLPTAPGGYSAGCAEPTAVAGDAGQQVTVVARYPRGRTVQVAVFLACDPALSNGSLTAAATPEQQTDLLRLLDALR